MLKKLSIVSKIFLLIVCAANAQIFGAHKYHTSFTKIEYNQAERLLEITVKVFAHDLLPTLEKRLKKPVDLESTKNIDEILQKYLAEKFVLKNKQGEIQNFRWIGKELEANVIIFYVEIPFEDELDGTEIKNTLFFESFREQVNLVSLRFGEKKADLMFKAGDDFKQIAGQKK